MGPFIFDESVALGNPQTGLQGGLSGLLSNPAFSNTLLALAGGLLTPARSTGEALGNAFNNVLQVSINHGRQRQLHDYYQQQIDAQKDRIAQKAKQDKAYQSLADKIKNNPGTRISDVFLESGIPDLISKGAGIRTLEDKQDQEKAKSDAEQLLLSESLAQEEDPIVRALFTMGEFGAGTSLINNRRRLAAKRQGPARQDPNFAASIEALTAEAGLEPGGFLPDEAISEGNQVADEDPRLAAERNIFRRTAEAVSASPSQGGVGRLNTALGSLERTRANIDQEKIKEAKEEVKRLEEEKAREKDKAISRGRIPSGTLAKEIEGYVSNIADNVPIGLEGDEAEELKRYVPIAAAKLNRETGIGSREAARHVVNRIIYRKMLKGLPLEAIINEPEPDPDDIRFLEEARQKRDPNYETILQDFMDLYKYSLQY